MINHSTSYHFVMMVEIPSLEVIFGVIVAFCVGLFVFYAYYKIRPYVNLKKEETNPDHLERLEYYERQLIDMKIRLDAIEMEPSMLESPPDTPSKRHEAAQTPDTIEKPRVIEKTVPVQAQRLPNMSTNSAADYVLHLVTDKSMTSRDIQITLGRSREHTSRLMKKLFEEGYVQRNEKVKPYTYSITQQGMEKIGIHDKIASGT